MRKPLRRAVLFLIVATATSLLPGCRWDGDPSDTHLTNPMHAPR